MGILNECRRMAGKKKNTGLNSVAHPYQFWMDADTASNFHINTDAEAEAD